MGEKNNKIVDFNKYKEEKSYQQRREAFAKKVQYIGEIQVPEQGFAENDVKEVQRKSTNKKKIKAEKRKVKKIVRAEVLGLAGLILVGGAVGVAKYHSNKNLKSLNQAKQEAMENQEKEEMSVEETIRKEINKMDSKDVRDFISNIYIELLEQQTKDTELTTEDIEFGSGEEYQDYVFVNNETGEITLHGKAPDVTKQKLENNGVSWHEEYDVNAYRVRKEGKIIDTMVYMDGKYTQAKEGNQYEEYDDNYTSILQKMGEVVPAGLKYAKKIEEKNVRESEIALLKKEFIDSLQKFVENEKEVEIENLTAKQPTIEEDDLEL